jgi:hypothetical protein
MGTMISVSRTGNVLRRRPDDGKAPRADLSARLPAMNYDAYGNPIKPKSSGVVLPVLLALLVSAGGNYWLWKERARLSGEAFTATAKLAAAEAVQKETAEKLTNLEAERAALAEAKELAVKDAQAKATELAKLKDDVAGVPGIADDKEPEGAAKGDVKAKADDKPAKDVEAKADPKGDAKSKSKSKSKKKSESHKKEKESAGSSSKPPADREL